MAATLTLLGSPRNAWGKPSAGDPGRFVELHGSELLGVARSFAGSEEDAHDALQRGFEVLLRKGNALAPEWALPYMKVVVRHEAFALSRAKGLRQFLPPVNIRPKVQTGLAMPRPLAKRSRPKPEDVTIRRVTDAESIEVVRPGELARRKEVEWQHHLRRRSEEQALLALKPGAPVVVRDYTYDVWWLVRDVNGIDRTITAATFLFDQPRESTFPFDRVTPVQIRDPAEHNEAAWYYAKLERRFGRPEGANRLKNAA